MIPFWVSFYSLDPSKWEYAGPWWVSLTVDDDDDDIGTVYAICVAVMATDAKEAWAVICAAHDEGHAPLRGIRRFMLENDPGWAPFTPRFERAPWMIWPWPNSTRLPEARP